MTHRPLVSILVAGVQKAGTTSLFSHLKEHPSLLAPNAKELHFFDNERINWKAPDYSSYHAHFPDDGVKRLAFEATPIYVFWPGSLARIQAYNPAMRLIVIFRDPIERAWSHWCMEYASAKEDLPFGLAIRQGRWRLRGIDTAADAWRVFSYVERGLYARQVRRLLEHFPRKQALFLRSIDLGGAPIATLAQISKFLEIEPFPSVPAKSDRPRANFPYPSTLTQQDISYLRSIFLPEVKSFAALTQLRVDDWLTCNPSKDEHAWA